MALKFLNKKGWHTGSLRNIENVWKAKQKHEAEQCKLEDLRKQIQDERKKSKFRLLQEQAGLVPEAPIPKFPSLAPCFPDIVLLSGIDLIRRQERLDFLYESGLPS
ncbi:hypothetical protein C4D60_Mb01t33390 [Musa balbisiana]|uniref:CBF1-interacting co-repressor CIR N-terminal domain-containing protein n=1 Tax=Musa balbisiana TaxID=52838 RepID=A0A4S8JSJ5_MUSBA|nr:hypothetical protein C4D60_Mb01t33390 [Musa balbisiana]